MKNRTPRKRRQPGLGPAKPGSFPKHYGQIMLMSGNRKYRVQPNGWRRIREEV